MMGGGQPLLTPRDRTPLAYVSGRRLKGETRLSRRQQLTALTSGLVFFLIVFLLLLVVVL
jgi:hypothetical protein